jgi:hypothetical protein
MWPDDPADVRSDKELSLYAKDNEKFYYRNFAGVIRELGGGTTVHTPRYVVFKKTLTSWVHGGAWTDINWSTNTIIYTNDLSGTEDPWTTWDTSVSGPAIFTGDTYHYHGVFNPGYIGTLKPGLFFIQVAASLTPNGEDFMIGFQTDAGINTLIPFLPNTKTWALYSSSLCQADGTDNPGMVSFQRTAIHTGGPLFGLNVSHLASENIPSADISISFAYLQIDPVT